MWQIVSLLKDPDLQEGFLTAPNVQYDDNGDRVLEEMNTGNFWVETQKLAPQGAVVVPINFYLDGTWLSNSGDQKTSPLCCTIGNFPLSVQNRSAAKRVSCEWLDLSCFGAR
jgi:hypothetical protein